MNTKIAWSFSLGLLILVVQAWMCSAMGGQCAVRKALTYNTALIDHAKTPDLPNNRMTRREAIIVELRRLNADVVCLQEVWIGQDVERLVDGLSDTYGYSYSKIHVPGKYGPVLPDQTGPFFHPCNRHHIRLFARCAIRNRCRGSKFEIYLCLYEHCYPQYKLLSQECITCGIASYSSGRAAMRRCAGNGMPGYGVRTVNSPGLLILSKTPLLNVQCTDYHPKTTEVIERGYLEANTPGLGKVVCTHNTHNTAYYPEMELVRTGTFISYTEQGHYERNKLIAKFGNINFLVLMGDFNVGDQFGPVINSDLPHEYYHMRKVFKSTPVQKCTICWPHENPYNQESEGLVNTIVDHVFYKGHKLINVNRVLTPVEATLDGLPLSDHNGVMASFIVC